MNLAIFGAGGATGIHLVNQALEAGHRVTAFARRPEALPFADHPRVKKLKGDLLDPATLDVSGHDAVLSTAGPAGRGPTKIYSQGALNLAEAMKRAGVRRLLIVTALGADLQPDLGFPQNIVFSQIVCRLLREVYDDTILMEQVLAPIDVDWTAVRAPRLTNGPHTGKVRYAVNASLHHPTKISRADVAHHLLEVLGEAKTFKTFTEPAW